MRAFTSLTASDGHHLDAYSAIPASAVRGGVVILQEAFGVNDHIQTVCDEYATHGFVAMAPALYDRQQRGAAFGYDPASMEQARGLRRGLSYELALLDIDATITALRPHVRVGVIGYCVGGSAAWLAAARLAVDAAACYYPSDMRQQLAEQPRAPVIVHFAERDHFITADVVAAFRAAHPEVPAYLYAADHGFNCSNRAHGYDAASAKLAFDRTIALLEEHVVAS
jgi:carboxymethylenebutenolidase